MKKVYIAFIFSLLILLTSIPAALITDCRLLHEVSLCEPSDLWFFYILVEVLLGVLGVVIIINFIFKLLIRLLNKAK